MEPLLNSSEKSRMVKVFFAVLLLLAVFLGIKAISAVKEYSYIGRGTFASNVISVTGTGEVFTVPDTGRFSYSVIEEGKSVKEAQDKATIKTNAILDALKALGVAEKDVKTVSYYSNPKYDYSQPVVCSKNFCPPSNPVLTGYEVGQTISVKVRKTADSGVILTKVGELGAMNISGLEFVTDDIDAVSAQARDKAIEDAKAKAKVLAKSLGIELGPIISFQEGENPQMYAAGGMQAKDAYTMQSAPTPQVPTGENKVTSTVNITYEIK
ncbi:SIMPL domain-containing protein [Patescibacteria group bacterium]|nr:SIMPL domain-containing protein [Patescibacteria group bacterium]